MLQRLWASVQPTEEHQTAAASPAAVLLYSIVVADARAHTRAEQQAVLGCMMWGLQHVGAAAQMQVLIAIKNHQSSSDTSKLSCWTAEGQSVTQHMSVDEHKARYR